MSGGEASPSVPQLGKLEGNCVHCGVNMGNFLGVMTDTGPVHNDCIPAMKRLQVERCVHCDCVLREARTILNGKKLHPECVADFKSKKPFDPPRKQGLLRKFAVGRSFFSGNNWKERFFVLSKQTGLAYYENKAAFDAGNAPKNALLITPQARLVTRPSRQLNRNALNPSTEFVVVFSEGGQERQLLMGARTWQEHDEWTRALETYIKIVDDPKDLNDQ